MYGSVASSVTSRHNPATAFSAYTGHECARAGISKEVQGWIFFACLTSLYIGASKLYGIPLIRTTPLRKCTTSSRGSPEFCGGIFPIFTLVKHSGQFNDWPEFLILWSGRRDSNSRPLAPHASALPSCATPRREKGAIVQKLLGTFQKNLVPCPKPVQPRNTPSVASTSARSSMSRARACSAAMAFS